MARFRWFKRQYDMLARNTGCDQLRSDSIFCAVVLNP